MVFVARSISIASPKVFERNKIFLPSGDQSARSPNQATCVMCRGKWSVGVSPAIGSAIVVENAIAETASAAKKRRLEFMRRECQKLQRAQGKTRSGIRKNFDSVDFRIFGFWRERNVQLAVGDFDVDGFNRSEEHTSELQSRQY